MEITKLYNNEYISDISKITTGYMSGYKIKTSKQEIFLGIENEQIDRENYGYFLSDSNYKSYKGCILKDIHITEACRCIDKLKELITPENKNDDVWVVNGGIIFVDIVTDKDILQFVAYDEYNYSGTHCVSIRSNQLTYSTNI